MIFDWFSGIIGAVMATLVCFALHTIDVNMIKASDARTLSISMSNLTKQCDDDKKITTEASHAYQVDLSTTHSELADLERVRGNACVILPASGTPAGLNGPPPAKRSNPENATTVKQFYDFSGECKNDRDKLRRLQDFNIAVWKANNQ